MSQENCRPRLQTFLFSIAGLLKSGKTESCSCIDEHLQKGIATYLHEKYPDVCKLYGAFITEIDDYFRDWNGCVENIASDFFDVQEDDGLWVLLFLVVNNMG